MAGDWIPVTVELPRRREVLAIAHETERDRHQVVGLLVDFWAWAQAETKDGNLGGLNVDALVRIVGADAHFWRALIAQIWLSEVDGGLKIPRFKKWMGRCAKSRSLKSIRQAKWRENKRRAVDGGASTKAPPEKRRVEKSREIQKNLPTEGSSEPLRDSEPPIDFEGDPVFSYPIVGTGGNGVWHLKPTKFEEYKASFPGVDVYEQCRRALQWCRDNPTKRKTSRGMSAFLFRWLDREQNKVGGNGSHASGRPSFSISDVDLGDE